MQVDTWMIDEWQELLHRLLDLGLRIEAHDRGEGWIRVAVT